MTFIETLAPLFSPMPLFLIFIGTFLGIVVGAIPGLTGSMLIVLTLPLTFTMPPLDALVLLISMYVGAISGGLISATLLRMPGTPASVMTTLDGYPMARSGQAAKALGFGISASLFGGIVSWVVLVALSRPLADLGAQFGPFEKFSLVLMALLLIASVSEGSIIRGLIAGLLGMMITMIGADPAVGTMRLTFGFSSLEAGLGVVPVLIGLFSVGQVLNEVMSHDRKPAQLFKVRIRDTILGAGDWMRNMPNLVRSSIVGTGIGILPGIGANIASAMAYTLARNASKTPEKFGKGSEEGIIASESANNASVGGALIPLIAMGIPASVIDAILLGAMMMQSITPGTLLFVNNPELVSGMMGSYLISVLLMYVIMVILSRYIAKLGMVPRSRLMPIIVVFCVAGTYANSNIMFDVWVMLAFGVLGFALEKLRLPLAPFVIGFILAPLAETNLRSGLMISGGSAMPILERPISLTFILITAGLLIWQVRKEVLSRKPRVAAATVS
jgi:putative tricarboxylic transport membrane protein